LFLFLKALGALMEADFENVYFRVPDMDPGTFQPPTVHIGAIMPRRGGGDKADFPFIVNRITTGQDGQNQSTFTAQTICGIYTADEVEAGENEILNMVCRVRGLLQKNQTIAAKYTMQYPINWRMGTIEDNHIQAYPFFGGTITSTWDAPAYEYLLNLEDQKKTYGYI